MNPIHIVTDKNNISENVLMPGDPLRAKYIADNFLTDAKLVNEIRNMYAYTGYYKGKRITVCASGMGIPSIGIYSYELFKFYNVEKIIRIGTSGTNKEDVKVLDVVLSSGAYSNSTFALNFSKTKDKFIPSTDELNQQILKTAHELNKKVLLGPTLTSDVFDVYTPIDEMIEECPFKDKLMCTEMEGFGLFTVAKYLNKEAAMLTTIVDSKFDKSAYVTPEMRQTSLNDMILIALESIIK